MAAEPPLPDDFVTAFVEVSAAVTGLSPLELHGTGLTGAHAHFVVNVLAASDNAQQFIDAIGTLAAAPDPATAIPVALRDAFLGPVLTNVIALWYLGQWLQLPVGWYHGQAQPSIDTNTIPSTLAYEQAFAWRLAGAHPPGSRPTGYGGWAFPPVTAVAVGVSNP